MAIKPILFNTAMSRAILDGRKTTTRRAVKRRYSNTEIEMYTNKYGTRLVERQNDAPAPEVYFDENGVKHTRRHLVACRECKSPYSVGDILWVRETWGIDKQMPYDNYVYRTDYQEKAFRWHPSIHMPKEAARTFLRVTCVRVERLQDITDDVCREEGIREWTKDGNLYKYYPADCEGDAPACEWQKCPRSLKGAMQMLWDSTIKKADLQRYGWNANPWVWVIEFERCEKPEAFV